MTIKDLKRTMDNKGYAFFDGMKPYNVNIIGVRTESNHDISNKFDDTLHLIYRDNNLIQKHLVYPITTDPGLYWTKVKKINPAGTAILKPGQYRSVYAIDLHNGKYEALCQRLGPVTVYRDKNHDNKYDFTHPQSGFFGINIHRSNPYGKSYTIDKWSAGCQVFSDLSHFNEFMAIIKKSAKLYGNKFTYTLLNESDVQV